MSGTAADPTNYAAFAGELIETRIISDPWVEGEERFRLDPVVLSKSQAEQMRHAVESVGRAYDEMIGILREDPELVARSFYLSPWQQAMWTASGGAWHGIARADAFLLDDGSVRICELNADTPSGEPEAWLLNRIRRRFHPELVDPNREFDDAFTTMLRRSWEATFPERAASGAEPRVGIVYPTDIPEDLSMIELYRRWCVDAGWNVELGSPYNLERDAAGRLRLLGRPIDLVIRHYKTDWWGEREPILDGDEEYLDPEPLVEPLRVILGADVDGAAAVVNPFGAILAQNKVMMAVLHSEIDRLTTESADAVRTYIPYSVRLDACDLDRIAEEKDRWVLKSDFGCEGDEVMIGPLATDEGWKRIVRSAVADRWIAQEYFSAAIEADGGIANFGLFLIGGRSEGIFTRFSSTSTDYRAVTAPTFVESG